MIDALACRLGPPRRRELFQARLAVPGRPAGLIGVVELRRGVAAGADLQAVVAALTEEEEPQQEQDAGGQALLAAGATAAAAAAAGPEAAAGSAASSPPPLLAASRLVQAAAHCTLPALDANFIGARSRSLLCTL